MGFQRLINSGSKFMAVRYLRKRCSFPVRVMVEPSQIAEYKIVFRESHADVRVGVLGAGSQVGASRIRARTQ